MDEISMLPGMVQTYTTLHDPVCRQQERSPDHTTEQLFQPTWIDEINEIEILTPPRTSIFDRCTPTIPTYAATQFTSTELTPHLLSHKPPKNYNDNPKFFDDCSRRRNVIGPSDPTFTLMFPQFANRISARQHHHRTNSPTLQPLNPLHSPSIMSPPTTTPTNTTMNPPTTTTTAPGAIMTPTNTTTAAQPTGTTIVLHDSHQVWLQKPGTSLSPSRTGVSAPLYLICPNARVRELDAILQRDPLIDHSSLYMTVSQWYLDSIRDSTTPTTDPTVDHEL
jgi:hypothetical protein